MMDFIRGCLQIDPQQRLQAEEALRHDWFSKDLLRDLEREIDMITSKRNQERLQKEIDEESLPGSAERGKQQMVEEAYFAGEQSPKKAE